MTASGKELIFTPPPGPGAVVKEFAPGVVDRVLADTLRILAAWDAGGALRDLPPRPAPEGRVVRKVVMEIFRHRAVLDWLADEFAAGRVRGRLRNLLRWGFCELLYLRGLAPAVVVDACVRHLKQQRRNAAEAGFANAVLRAAAAAGPDRLLLKVAAQAPPEVRLELGGELWNQWRRHFEPAELQRLAATLLEPAGIYARQRQPGGALPLGLQPLEPCPWAPEQHLFLITEPEAFFASAEFAAGAYYVQDPSTLLAPRLLGATPGEKVLDMCAAPGGKALLLAEAVGAAGLVCAADISLRRLGALRENAAGQPQLQPLAADGAAPPFAPGTFDAVLLDAPCSNTGVVGRRPDVRWRFTAAGLTEICGIQARLLRQAAAMVRPGGRLVYSTCSIEAEEDSLQVEKFLSEHSAFTLEAENLLLPDRGHDGAYAARLARA